MAINALKQTYNLLTQGAALGAAAYAGNYAASTTIATTVHSYSAYTGSSYNLHNCITTLTGIFLARQVRYPTAITAGLTVGAAAIALDPSFKFSDYLRHEMGFTWQTIDSIKLIASTVGIGLGSVVASAIPFKRILGAGIAASTIGAISAVIARTALQNRQNCTSVHPAPGSNPYSDIMFPLLTSLAGGVALKLGSIATTAIAKKIIPALTQTSIGRGLTAATIGCAAYLATGEMAMGVLGGAAVLSNPVQNALSTLKTKISSVYQKQFTNSSEDRTVSLKQSTLLGAVAGASSAIVSYSCPYSCKTITSEQEMTILSVGALAGAVLGAACGFLNRF